MAEWHSAVASEGPRRGGPAQPHAEALGPGQPAGHHLAMPLESPLYPSRPRQPPLKLHGPSAPSTVAPEGKRLPGRGAFIRFSEAHETPPKG